MSIVVTFNGVIRRDRDQSMITEGTHLYRSLNETNRVLLLTDNRERTDIWLKSSNRNAFIGIQHQKPFGIGVV